MSASIRPPTPRPCDSCPYRRDVPSGIWAVEEYEKLRRYDVPTPEQPAAVFLCHQNDRGSETSRLCSGWLGCHDTHHLLALRIAALDGTLDTTNLEAAVTYETSVPLFATGNEAADHGEAAIAAPGPDAVRFMDKITRVRRDLEDSQPSLASSGGAAPPARAEGAGPR
ncbi:DUF6283 family protein [Streptomyces clavifer]|uniref:DUF6283 family protein n=1 Tax=Streptomyces clavifer TaxID=68188 RepID=UPI00365E4677